MLSEHVRTLIGQAKTFGLPYRDVTNATEMLEHAESGVAFDIIVQQLYEYGILIDDAYYQLIKITAEKMKLPEQDFIFLKELIK